MLLIILIVLLVLALGGIPNVGYHPYGWYPSGILTVVLIVLLVYLLVPWGR